MAFGEWTAHAQPEHFGRDVLLNIGREVAPNQWHLVTGIDGDVGATVKTVDDVPDGTFLPTNSLRIPTEMAETMYKALDRIFGKTNADGADKVLREVLAKEQTRVDFFLNRMIGGASS